MLFSTHQPNKGKSPAEDPDILSNMKERFRYLTEEVGYSKNAAYELMAPDYGLSAQGVRHWLDARYRENKKRAHQRNKSYMRHTPEAVEKTNAYQRRYLHLRNNIPAYLDKIFQLKDYRPLSREDIISSIEDLTSIRMRNITLENLIRKHEIRLGKPLLHEVSSDEKEPMYLPNR